MFYVYSKYTIYAIYAIYSKDIIKLYFIKYFIKGLSISIGTLLMEQLTGIYAELAFLDVALNFGQSLITFAIFGLDTDLGKLGCWLRKMCRKWRAGTKLFLLYILFFYL